MKKSVFVVALLFVVTFCFAAQALAGPIIDQILKKKELVVGTSASYPPLTFKAKDGQAYGLDMDVAQAIAFAMGVNLRKEIIPFEDLIPALEKGKIDLIISSMTITPQRNLRVAYIGPYFISGQAILTTKELAINLNGAADVNKPDFSISVPRGTTTEIIAKNLLPKAKIVVAASTTDALAMLMNKKVKAMMADYPYVTVEAFRNKDKGYIAIPPFSVEPLGIAVRADDPLFLNFLDNTVGVMRGDGLMNTLVQRWFNNPAWMANLP